MIADTSKFHDKDTLFGLIFMLGNQLQTAGDRYFKDITAKQWFVLAALHHLEDHQPTLGELAEVVGSSHQNVKQLVAKLAQKDCLVLDRDVNDNRRMRIRLTEKGEELYGRYHMLHQRFLVRLFEGMEPEDMSGIIQLLKIIQDNLSKTENFLYEIAQLSHYL